MDYKEALKVKDANQNLIGTKDEKGFIITTIIIVPSDSQLNKQFLESFLWNKNAELSLAPYINEDLKVWAIDEIHLKRDNILVHRNLH